MIVDQLHEMGVGEEGLGRDAAPVQADAAELVALDAEGLLAELRGPDGAGVARRAAADDEDVVVVGHALPSDRPGGSSLPGETRTVRGGKKLVYRRRGGEPTRRRSGRRTRSEVLWRHARRVLDWRVAAHVDLNDDLWEKGEAAPPRDAPRGNAMSDQTRNLNPDLSATVTVTGDDSH